MRILIATQYFSPELTAASLRLEPFAAGLAGRGHDVEVLCEAPSHPHGVVPPEFRSRLVTRRRRDGYRVSHVWVKASPSKRARARLASYASYAAAATAVGAAMERVDVVLASSPPLPVGAVGSLLAARHRCPWVLDVRDLWPQAALALGEVEPGRVADAAEWLERRLYRGATAVTTPTRSFADHIAEIAEDAEKVEVIANGTTAEWLEAGEAEPDREGAELPADRFVWTYAGNLGLSQDLEVAIEAAAILGDGFELLLLGDGTRRIPLEEAAAERPAGNVRFRSAVPPAEAMRIMRASDALLVSLAEVPALGRSIPVKLYDSCAIGRPVVVAAPGAVRELAERESVGVTIDPGDPVALADAIRELAADPERCTRLAAGGRAFAASSLRELGVEKLNELLTAVVAR